jgi:RNA polymerase sigma-70 factor, ECF subfamily
MPGGSDAGADPIHRGVETGTEPFSDEALARRVQDTGDRAALDQLVRRYLRAVHAVVASILPDPEAIDDAAQETFLRALGAIDRYDARRPFAPWLYQIARNVARNDLSRRSRWKTEPLEPDRQASRTPAPDDNAERAQIRTRIDEALRQLPEQRRIALRLVDVEEMTAVEAGRIMGLSPGTVRSHVHHARRELRQALTEFRNPKTEAGG